MPRLQLDQTSVFVHSKIWISITFRAKMDNFDICFETDGRWRRTRSAAEFSRQKTSGYQASYATDRATNRVATRAALQVGNSLKEKRWNYGTENWLTWNHSYKLLNLKIVRKHETRKRVYPRTSSDTEKRANSQTSMRLQSHPRSKMDLPANIVYVYSCCNKRLREHYHVALKKTVTWLETSKSLKFPRAPHEVVVTSTVTISGNRCLQQVEPDIS